MTFSSNALIRFLLAGLMAATLAACSGGDIGSTGGGGGTGVENPDNPDDPNETSALRLGANNDNGQFVEGQISVNPNPVANGVSTTLTTRVTTADGASAGAGLQVQFSAACSGASVVSPVSTDPNGVASTTYVADASCAGADTVSATLSRNGQSLTATGEVQVRVVRIGSFDENRVFQENVIVVEEAEISARGTTGLRVSFVDQNDDLVTDQRLSVSFMSEVCGTDAALDSPVLTANGIARSTYEDLGCASASSNDAPATSVADRITASTSSNGRLLEATGDVTVLPANLGALEFVSAEPTVIALEGTGGQGLQETSTVTFRVRDSVGDPVEGQTVNFAITPPASNDTTGQTGAGGSSLSDTSGVTNSEGIVSVVVSSGSVHTTIRVNASTTGRNPSGQEITIRSQSDQLVITSGLADQNSLTLVADELNIDTLGCAGAKVELTVFAADRFNNPVPQGTAFAFTTEGGKIDGQCFADDKGECIVTWTSQNPVPVDGRSTVLVTAIGEEGFTDVNGNGRFDAGEPFRNLPEAILNRNENRDAATGNRIFDQSNSSRTNANGSVRTDNIEPDSLVDFDSDGTRDEPSADAGGNPTFTGVLCESGCDDRTTLNVREDLVLIFSGGAPTVERSIITDNDGDDESFFDAAGNECLNDDAANDDAGGGNLDPSCDGSDQTVNLGQVNGEFTGAATIGVTLRDVNEQPLPSGTTISLSSTLGAPGNPATQTVPSTNNDTLAGNTYFFSLEAPDGDEADSGTATLSVSTPGNQCQGPTDSFFRFPVRFVPAPAPTP